EPPDMQRFPCLRLAFEAVAGGGTAPAVLNAANEVAVARFLEGRLGFVQIAEVVERTLAEFAHGPADDLETLLGVDRRARAMAEQEVAALV
ncbi:MAG: 1-deoxy-D-xylulose-5-phosphate reductoisomerase, partial [Gammaproteobacteria bacterium]|nr:1-deoxy-D-xylulose-5-phosphate reductoisomerase [Gammaproteobacteria bacterium]